MGNLNDKLSGDYKFVKTLGTGYNSKVKLAHEKTSNKYYAVKLVRLSDPKLNLKYLKNEIQVLSKLKHPNIINLIEYHESVDYVKKDGQSYKAFAIVTELATGGELFNYVAETGGFSEEVTRLYFKALIEAVEYCHAQGITHRDLKPENLLLDSNFNLKVADFGFATSLYGKDGSKLLHTWLGTEGYMAPEIVLNEPYDGPAVDIFACGVILFVLRSAQRPFFKADPQEDILYKSFTKGRQNMFWKSHEKRIKTRKDDSEGYYSEDFKDLVNKMIDVDPEKRFTINQIKEHPWYKGPIADLETIKATFNEKNKEINLKLEKEKEENRKRKQEMAVKKANYGIFGGVKPFRSCIGVEGLVNDELAEKVGFERERKLVDYETQEGSQLLIQHFTTLSIKVLFQLVCSLSKRSMETFIVSPDTYKIKGMAVADAGRCELNIVLMKVDEETNCVEFRRKRGNIEFFYDLVRGIRKGVSDFEFEDSEEKEK